MPEFTIANVLIFLAGTVATYLYNRFLGKPANPSPTPTPMPPATPSIPSMPQLPGGIFDGINFRDGLQAQELLTMLSRLIAMLHEFKQQQPPQPQMPQMPELPPEMPATQTSTSDTNQALIDIVKTVLDRLPQPEKPKPAA